MKHRIIPHLSLTMIATVAVLSAIGSAGADDKLPGQIHDYPGEENASNYKPHQLEFEFHNDGIARAEFRSEEFYAIILKSAERCAVKEEERLQIQSLFPKNKVFMNLFDCDDPEDNITYSNTDWNYSFIAVFGGRKLEQAQRLLEDNDLATKFPGANIRKMQAIWVHS